MSFQVNLVALLLLRLVIFAGVASLSGTCTLKCEKLGESLVNREKGVWKKGERDICLWGGSIRQTPVSWEERQFRKCHSSSQKPLSS